MAKVLKTHLLLIVLAISLGMSAISIMRYNDSLQSLAAMKNDYLQTSVRDRLTGTYIDLAELSGGQIPQMAESRGDDPTLLWIVNADECINCFDQLGTWRRFERLTDYRMVLVLVGSASSAVQGSLRLLRRTEVVRASMTSVTATIGPLLSNATVE